MCVGVGTDIRALGIDRSYSGLRTDVRFVSLDGGHVQSENKGEVNERYHGAFLSTLRIATWIILIVIFESKTVT